MPIFDKIRRILESKEQACICERATARVLCNYCGFMVKGRLAYTCPLHQNVQYLMDLKACPKCKSEVDKMSELPWNMSTSVADQKLVSSQKRVHKWPQPETAGELRRPHSETLFQPKGSEGDKSVNEEHSLSPQSSSHLPEEDANIFKRNTFRVTPPDWVKELCRPSSVCSTRKDSVMNTPNSSKGAASSIKIFTEEELAKGFGTGLRSPSLGAASSERRALFLGYVDSDFDAEDCARKLSQFSLGTASRGRHDPFHRAYVEDSKAVAEGSVRRVPSGLLGALSPGRRGPFPGGYVDAKVADEDYRMLGTVSRGRHSPFPGGYVQSRTGTKDSGRAVPSVLLGGTSHVRRGTYPREPVDMKTVAEGPGRVVSSLSFGAASPGRRGPYPGGYVDTKEQKVRTTGMKM